MKRRKTVSLSEGGGFVLNTDSSDKAIGVVLSQVQDGKERVVAYGSFVLSTTQRNYCVTRRELWCLLNILDIISWGISLR